MLRFYFQLSLLDAFLSQLPEISGRSLVKCSFKRSLLFSLTEKDLKLFLTQALKKLLFKSITRISQTYEFIFSESLLKMVICQSLYHPKGLQLNTPFILYR